MKTLTLLSVFAAALMSSVAVSAPIQSYQYEAPMQRYVYTYSLENQVETLMVDIANASSEIIADARIDTILEANENVQAIGAEMRMTGLVARLISPIESTPDEVRSWARDPFRRTY
ncbi:hypothetical protein [Pseudidiomarina aestuarii]|uniref:hypothetical protein n=1 Tax=Pseudidiomarina aestuarii TaxID=624146 RepID=UPI003A97A0C6